MMVFLGEKETSHMGLNQVHAVVETAIFTFFLVRLEVVKVALWTALSSC